MSTTFATTNQRELAHLLADRLLALAGKMPRFALATALVNDLRRHVWQDVSPSHPPKKTSGSGLKKSVGALIEQQETDEQKEAALALWLRLGQLYELAALVARANLVDLWRDPEKPRLPGGITDMVTTALAAGVNPLEALTRPVFEVVMTAHPTNVNDSESILALRNIGQALDGLRTSSGETKKQLATLDKALTGVLNARAIPERITAAGERVPTNLSVHAETELILYYLGAVYDDLPLVYGGFDRVLTRKLGGEYDPAQLMLNFRFSSWGSSGDKDGNSQITAGTTLEAIVMHHHEIIRRYRETLDALPKEARTGKLPLWRNRLASVENRLEALRAEVRATLAPINAINAETLRLEALVSEEGHAEQIASIRATMRAKRLHYFSPQKFRVFSADLQDILWELGEYPKQDFLAVLKDAYETATGDARTQLLLFLRRVRCFGFQFARIEFRETAAEYTRVVGDIFAVYRRLHPNDSLLPDAPYETLPEPKKITLLSTLIESGKAPTIMAQVREDIEFRGAGLMYDDENAAPIALHTLLRMELARDFPDMITANVLAECEQLSQLLEAQFLQSACTDGEGRHPVMGIVPLYEEPAVMKQVGHLLSRAYSNVTYRRHLTAVAEHLFARGYGTGRATQQVQIAHSDNTRRAGLPAARALIYQAHDLIRQAGKEAGIVTQFFEGGSNSDPFRGGIRSISATANMYDTHDFIKFTFQGGDLLNYFNYAGSTERLFARNLSHMAKTLVQKERGVWTAEGTDENDHPRNLKLWTEAALPPLIATTEDYRHDIFSKEAIGRFLYETRDTYGNTGSRAGARGSNRAKVQQEKAEKKIDPLNMRTITFSESFAHAGITPTWLGIAVLEARLQQALAPLAPATLHDLYSKSAIFRDVADRIAFGVAMSDIAGLARYYPALKNDPFTAYLKEEYQAAARLAAHALSDKPATPLPEETDAIREYTRRLMPHLYATMQHKSAYMTAVQEMKRAWRKDRGKSAEEKNASHRWVMSLAHAAIDCVTHGRMPFADDPMYRKMALASVAGLEKKD